MHADTFSIYTQFWYISILGEYLLKTKRPWEHAVTRQSTVKLNSVAVSFNSRSCWLIGALAHVLPCVAHVSGPPSRRVARVVPHTTAAWSEGHCRGLSFCFSCGFSTKSLPKHGSFHKVHWLGRAGIVPRIFPLMISDFFFFCFTFLKDRLSPKLVPSPMLECSVWSELSGSGVCTL